jgi:uncharacterized protein with GYD domain
VGWFRLIHRSRSSLLRPDSCYALAPALPTTSKQSERVKKAKAKLDKLGIKIESIHYTQGHYDYVDIVDAPNPQAMLAFSVWYSTQHLGRIQTMPAFDPKSFETAIKDATG